MSEEHRTGVIIPTAGQGTRMKAATAKQFLLLDGMPLFLHAVMCFEASPDIDAIVLAAARENVEEVRELVRAHRLTKVVAVVAGGEKRQDSVWNGLQELLKYRTELLLVHDAVRPFIDQDLIHALLKAAQEFGAALSAVPVKETLKRSRDDLIVSETPRREEYWLAQTPQAFRQSLFLEAFRKARNDHFYGTDDTSLVERLGNSVKIIPGSYQNIKITTPEDLDLARLILSSRKTQRT